MNDHQRGKLPNDPRPSDGPIFPAYANARRHLPPGPGRRGSRRHFARQEGMGLIIMAVMVLVILYWIGRDLGMFAGAN